jgi:hypothetical protein
VTRDGKGLPQQPLSIHLDATSLRRPREATWYTPMPGIFIFQIEYSKSVPLDPGFLVLDNIANERPDWFEYWPTRKFLLGEALHDESFYGFLSPRFWVTTSRNEVYCNYLIEQRFLGR